MKFLKLELQAFGPFKEKTIIDFANLNSSGLFLITGNTGMGKTSLFDAISFALYGETSDYYKTTGKIRCDEADADTLTYVDLTFEIGDKSYFIHREPQQIINVKKGALREHSHYATLKSQNREIIGPNNVTQMVKDLTGLDATMFKQVVLLPQNEFRRLLNSSSKDKLETFRNIFGTNVITSFQKKLSSDVAIMENSIKHETDILNTKIADLDNKYSFVTEQKDNNYDLIFVDIEKYIKETKEKISILNKEYENYKSFREDLMNKYNNASISNEKLNSLNEVIKENEQLNNDTLIDEYRNILKNYNNASELKKNIDELENIINESNEYIKDLEELKKEEKEKTDIKNNLQAIRNSLKERADEIENLKIKRMKLEAELENSEKKKNLMDNYLKYDEMLNDTSIDCDDLQAKLDEITNKYNKINEECKTLEPEIEDIATLFEKKEEAKNTKEELVNLKAKWDRIDEIVNELDSYQDNFESLKRRSLQAYSDITTVNKTLNLNLAYKLAKNLKDKQPCPVCGSTIHPNLAEYNENVTDKDLEKAQEDSARIKAEIEALNTNKQKIAIEKNELVDYISLSQLRYELGVTKENVDELIIKYDAQITFYSNRIEEVKELTTLYNEKKEELVNLDKDKTDIENEIKNMNNGNSDLNEKINIAKIQLAMLSDVRDYKVISSEINEIVETINKFNEEYKKVAYDKDEITEQLLSIAHKVNMINNDLNSNNGKKSILDSKIKELKKCFKNEEDYNKCLNVDFDEINNYVRSYDSKKAIIDSKLIDMPNNDISFIDVDSIKDQITNNDILIEDTNKTIVELETRNNTIMAKLSEIKENYSTIKNNIIQKNKILKLSNLANGNNKSGQTFEMYVLSIYFEEVLYKANTYLNQMSNGKYLFVGRHNQLEFDILDTNSKKRRDAKTLSGGESFEAALAITLGLSDVIKENNGIIKIDTLFIDEGFEGLDSEALNQAYDILCGLKNENKVIGIISHIRDLKNKINEQIVVYKENDLSKIKIVV